jgi:NADPH:quinone reductase-like Zn-dependent oxidoreductase
VLTLGSGGVSLFALQFAKLYGLRVIATTSSDQKAKQLQALGADEVVNYRSNPDWHEAVRKLTGGRGVDYVIEVGGAGTLVNSLKSVAVQGQISWVGVLASGEPMISLGRVTKRLRQSAVRGGRQSSPFYRDEPSDRSESPETGHRSGVFLRGGCRCLSLLPSRSVLRKDCDRARVRTT